jgi:8-oxo-dGTP pyrophosphatase MutT (NUDIX family)
MAQNYDSIIMRIKSFVLIEKDDQYLLIKEAAPKWDEKWFLPGGNLKKGESPELAAIRETYEEAGCEIKLKGIIYTRYYTSFFNRRLNLFYLADIIGEKIKEKEDKHSLSVKWFSYDELSKLPLRQKLMDIINAYRKQKIAIPVNSFRIIS